MPNPSTMPAEATLDQADNKLVFQTGYLHMADGTLYVGLTDDRVLVRPLSVFKNTSRGEGTWSTFRREVDLPSASNGNFFCAHDAANDGDAAPEQARITAVVVHNNSGDGVSSVSFNQATETWDQFFQLNTGAATWSVGYFYPIWNPFVDLMEMYTGWTTEKFHGTDYNRLTRTRWDPTNSLSVVNIKLSPDVGTTQHQPMTGSVNPADGSGFGGYIIGNGPSAVTLVHCNNAGTILGSITTSETYFQNSGSSNNLLLGRYWDTAEKVVATGNQGTTTKHVMVFDCSTNTPTRPRSDAFVSYFFTRMHVGHWPRPGSTGGTDYWYVASVLNAGNATFDKYDPVTGALTNVSLATYTPSEFFQDFQLATWGPAGDVYAVGATPFAADQWFNWKLQPEGTTFQQSVAGSIAPAGTVTPVQVFNFQQAVAGTIASAGESRPAQLVRTTNRATPIADRSTASWTSTGATFFSEVDEFPFVSTDYVTSDSSTVTTSLGMDLGSITDPSGDGSIRLRALVEMVSGTPDGSHRISFEWRSIAPDANLSSTQQHFFKSNGIELVDIVLDVTDARRILPDLIAGNVYTDIQGASGGAGAIQVRLHALELLVDDTTPAGELPGWSEVWAPYEGSFGPVVCNGAYWAIAFSGNRAYLYRATAPTDGHNPGEWVLQASLAGRTESGFSPHGAELVAEGNVLHWVVWGAVPSVATAFGRIQMMGSYNTATGQAASGTSITTAVNKKTAFALGGRSDGDTVTAYGDNEDTGNGARIQVATGASTGTSNFDLSALSSGVAVLGGVKVGDRLHTFFTDDTDLDDGAIRMRTITGTNALEASEAAFSSGTRRTFSGSGVAWNNGSDQVAQPMKVTAGGLKIARFVSADSVPNASITEQDATARQTYDADLKDSVVMVVDATNNRVWAFWIDPVDGFNIRASSADDGLTTWVDRGEQLAARAARRVLSGGDTKIGSGNVAIFLESDRNGQIFYREISIDTGVTFQQSVAGTLPSSGVLSRSAQKILAGVAGSAGALLKSISSSLAGTLPNSGALLKRISKTLSGSIGSTGVVTLRKFIGVVLSGTIGSAGALIRRTSTTLTGALNPSAALSRIVSLLQSGTLGSAGTLLKRAQSRLSGALTPTGAISTFKFAARLLAGTISSTGDLIRTTAKTLTGTSSSSGAVTKTTRTTLAGTISSTGSLLKSIGKLLAGALASAGAVITNVIPGTFQQAVAGTIASAGVLLKKVSTAVDGTLGSAGAVTPIVKIIQQIAGTIGSAGALLKRISRSGAGTLPTAGDVTKSTAKLVAGSISSTGALAAVRKFVQQIAGTISSAGAVLKKVSTTLAGSSSSSGSVAKRISKTLSGALTPAATILKTARLVLSGVLSGAGSVATNVISGTFQQAVSGVLGLAGALSRAVSKRTAGTLPTAGSVTKSSTKTLTGVLTPAGDLYRLLRELLAGVIGSSGDLSRRVGVRVAGTVGSAGAVLKTVGVLLEGSLAPVGARIAASTKTLAGVIGFVGSVTANKFRTTVGPFGPGRIRQQGRSSSRIQNQGRSSRRI